MCWAYSKLRKIFQKRYLTPLGFTEYRAPMVLPIFHPYGIALKLSNSCISNTRYSIPMGLLINSQIHAFQIPD
ncbi:MAG: hypothetical protein ACI9M3_001392, partial [Bacteroidia bacterium]